MEIETVDLDPQDKNMSTEIVTVDNTAYSSTVTKEVSVHLYKTVDGNEIAENIIISVHTKKFSSVITLPESVCIDLLIDCLQDLKKKSK
jgi:hypothetical protein